VLKHSLRGEHQRFSKEFYASGTQRLTHSYEKCVDNGDFLKNSLNFVKDLSYIYIYIHLYICACIHIYVNFIVIVTAASDEKRGGITFRADPLNRCV